MDAYEQIGRELFEKSQGAPILLIGMGGVGGRIVAQIDKMLAKDSPRRDKVAILAIDTNVKDLRKLREQGATVTSECIGGLFPILYFARKNSSLLKLGRTHFNGKIFLRACGNGSSELMTNLSSSIVNSLYNIQLMNLAGENGVAAFGTIMYVNFIFIAIFLGYSIGSAPLVSYHYGAGNHDELKNLFGKSLRLIGIWGLMLFILAQLIDRPLAAIFVGYDADLFSMTQNGFRIYCIAYLINGFNIYGSSFFTALNNGLISAAISFLRTLVFQLAAVLLLPLLLSINGIWSAVAVAELLTLGLTVTFFVRNHKKYHYA